MERYIGKMLDNRYEILEVIGRAVWRWCSRPSATGSTAWWQSRCSSPNWRMTRSSAAVSTTESQAVAMLSHPNIVSVYDVSRGGGLEYIVMELIDGITLKQYWSAGGQLNWREALHFITQVCGL